MNGEQFTEPGINPTGMQCPKCNGISSLGSRFCGHCGEPFHAAPIQPAPQYYDNNPPQQDYPPQSYDNNQPQQGYPPQSYGNNQQQGYPPQYYDNNQPQQGYPPPYYPYPPQYMAPPARSYTGYTIWSALNILIGSWVFSIFAFLQISQAKKCYNDSDARKHIRNAIIINTISNVVGILALIFIISLD